MSTDKYTVKTGRFNYDPETKKVKVCKDKGELSIFSNAEGENHVTWINLDLNIEEIDIIVFPFDAVFEKLPNQNNTYVLRFQSNEDKYFFYLQEKVNFEEFVKKVNELIAYIAPEPMEQESSQPVSAPIVEKKLQSMQVEKPKEEKVNQSKLASDMDFITRLQNNLMAAKKNEIGITHLSKILTQEAINVILNESSPEQKQQLVQFLPQEQKDSKHIASNLRSPQYQQAVDVLSDALNSQNAIPLFMELGLDQKFLQKNYGVHAFLKALEEKYRSVEKKQ